MDFLSSDQTLCWVQSNSPYIVTTQMLGNFENKSVLQSLHFKGIQNWWKVSLKLHIDNGTNNLRNFTDSHGSTTEGSYLV